MIHVVIQPKNKQIKQGPEKVVKPSVVEHEKKHVKL